MLWELPGRRMEKLLGELRWDSVIRIWDGETGESVKELKS